MSAAAAEDCEIVVIGAGIIGVSIAAALAQSGHDVLILDAGSVVAGSTAAGEGNLLLSDKLPGPELDLALWSLQLWSSQAEQLGSAIEFETKGGLVVARSEQQMTALLDVLEAQRSHGLKGTVLSTAELHEIEPLVTADTVGGVLYPGDCQIQPVLATAALIEQHDLKVATNSRVSSIDSAGDTLTVHVGDRAVRADWVVNAAGAWAGEVAALAGCELDIQPRRGRILVTEPLETLIHHKVYEADYVAATQSSDAQVQFSSVVEGTAAGTVLLGSSREFAGFDQSMSMSDLAALAQRAVGLFPFLASVRTMRTYTGFRAASPDHLPVIGPDPQLPRLIHATGHEGAGIGLAPATARLVAHHIDGLKIPIESSSFLPARFTKAESS